MDNFYVTLRSDDSLELYPQNSPTKFSNKLPYPLDFTNEYEVAASSLFLDLPVREMTVSAYAVRLNLEGKGIRNPKESFAIQQFTLTADDIVLDLLNKIEDVIDRLYQDEPATSRPKLLYDEDDDHFTIKCPTSSEKNLFNAIILPEMMNILGFGDKFSNSTYEIHDNVLFIIAKHSPSFYRSSKLLLLQSNLVYESIFGSKTLPIPTITSQIHHAEKNSGYERIKVLEYKPIRNQRF